MQLTKKESMTSLELLKEINFFRKKEREENNNDSRLLKDCSHDNLLKTIREEFSEEIDVVELNESKYYSNGKEYPMFVLTFSQSKQVLLKESKYVRKAVLQYIENLEKELKEVLPQLSEMEIILKVVNNQIAMDKKFIEMDNKIDSVINKVTLESGKQRKIQLAVSKRVFERYEIIEKIEIEKWYQTYGDYEEEETIGLNTEFTKEIIRKLYSNIYRDIKRKFGVASYKDIKVVEYEKALNFIENWLEDREVI